MIEKINQEKRAYEKHLIVINLIPYINILKKDHNIWNYLYFIAFIKIHKDEND